MGGEATLRYWLVALAVIGLSLNAVVCFVEGGWREMARVSERQVGDYLQRHQAPGLTGPAQIVALPAEFEGDRFGVSAGETRYIMNCYAPSARDGARREAEGLRICGGMGMAPALVAFDEDGAELGGPVVLSEAVAGEMLGVGQLDDGAAHEWLFLLLTLHHLPADATRLASSMSADAQTWWQRTQPGWEACRAAYAGPQYGALLGALGKLHTIVGVHLEAHRGLWSGITRRPCHGNPAPGHVVRSNGRLTLVEWDGFGLGDPAMEVGRAAGLAALSGELGAEQYVSFIADYLAGMRDLRDGTLGERLRVFASALPLGFCFTALRLVAQTPMLSVEERAGSLGQVVRALTWVQDTLGVDVGSAEALVAPLR